MRWFIYLFIFFSSLLPEYARGKTVPHEASIVYIDCWLTCQTGLERKWLLGHKRALCMDRCGTIQVQFGSSHPHVFIRLCWWIEFLKIEVNCHSSVFNFLRGKVSLFLKSYWNSGFFFSFISADKICSKKSTAGSKRTAGYIWIEKGL